MKSRTHPEQGTPPPLAPPEKKGPSPLPFTVPNREEVTGEPEKRPGFDPRYPDVSWVSHPQMGGGHVPEDFFWRSNPYEEREERGVIG